MDVGGVPSSEPLSDPPLLEASAAADPEHDEMHAAGNAQSRGGWDSGVEGPLCWAINTYSCSDGTFTIVPTPDLEPEPPMVTAS